MQSAKLITYDPDTGYQRLAEKLGLKEAIISYVWPRAATARVRS